MSGKPGPPPAYAMYPQGGPPPQAGAPPGAAAYNPPPGATFYPGPPPGTTVIVNAPPQQKVVHRSSPGIFGSITNEINKFGKSVDREVNTLVKTVNHSFDQCATSAILNLFNTNNAVQLLSRVSGKSVQIVQSPNGLAIDAAGPDGPQAYNAVWTVINEGQNQVRLHNNNNYLAIVNGSTVLINMSPGVQHGVETKFQLCLAGGQFITIESMRERGRHIGFLPNGQLKSALSCGKDMQSHFGVRLIYSPYGQPGAAVMK